MKRLVIFLFILIISVCVIGCGQAESINSQIESSTIVSSQSSSSVYASSSTIVNTTNKESKYDSKYLNMEIPAGYYMLLDTSKSGYEFRESLSKIISANYVKHSYSYNNTVLAKSDVDPENPGKVLCIYTGLSLASGVWNKEHVWAKSHGFPESGYSSSEPYCDAHHLRASLEITNSTRGNLDFGEVSDTDSNVKSDAYGNKWNDEVFEPRDEAKGDIARMMFYMATRYGFDNQFNLTLTNDRTTSNSTLNGKFGGLDTLIKWHYEDPVSDSEIYRNNVIYADYQKNRNPYIDHPEYVDLAYPNDYKDIETDEAKVSNVINLINAIPGEICLNDKDSIDLAKAEYNALNYKEKEMVTNYSKLEAAVSEIQRLEEEVKESENVGTKYSYVFESNVYSGNNQTKTLGDFNWTLSFTGGGIQSYDASRGLHLGSNNNPCSGVTLVSENSFNNVSKVIINASGNSGIVATLNCSVGSTCVSSFELTKTATEYTYEFDNASGIITINFVNNSQKAVYIMSITVYYE